jgi:hypothetical protein
MKQLGPVARQTLLKFYNSTLKVRTPINWGNAEIIPILKRAKIPNILRATDPLH